MAQKPPDQSVESKKYPEHKYPEIYIVGLNGLEVPKELLLKAENLQAIDLTYFLTKSHEMLKLVYDSKFKEHKDFKDLKEELMQMDLQQTLLDHFFGGPVNQA